MIEITPLEKDYFVCKKDTPYHRTGKAGCRACSKWTKEDLKQVKDFYIDEYMRNARKDSLTSD